MTSPRDEGRRPVTACPHCQLTTVAPVLRTSMVIYLRCVSCAWVWSIAERRSVVRSDDHVRVFQY